MAVDPTRIRTVALVGQGGAGKTTLADALAFAGGGLARLGRVDDGTSIFDTEPEEQRRRCSITSSLHHLAWNRHEVTILDTPGQGNFVADAHYALRGAAGVVLVVDATTPLRAEAAKAWNWAADLELPAFLVVSKCDRPEADLEARLAELSEDLGLRPVLMTMPIAEGGAIRGVVDVLDLKAFVYDGASGKCTAGEIPASMAGSAREWRAKLAEAAAEGDDELLAKYLDQGDLEHDDMLKGLSESMLARTCQPVVCLSGLANVGMVQLLDAIERLFPAPCTMPPARGKDDHNLDIEIAPDPAAPFAGFVFKSIHDAHVGQLSVFRVMAGTVTADTPCVNAETGKSERLGHLLKMEGRKTREVASATVGEVIAVAKLKDTHAGQTLADASRAVRIEAFDPVTPAISFAIEAKKRGEEDKAMQGLQRLCEEDLALHVDRHEETHQILVSGSGQLHLEVACERLERKYGVGVVLKSPQVPYRETIRAKAPGHGRLKKQSGGHGQFADCRVEVEPLGRGAGFEFVDRVVGGSIPRNYIPAVEKGAVDALKSGVLAGFPVVDVRVTLLDGQFHDVDSSEMAFRVAGAMAVREALAAAGPTLLEPFGALTVTAPDACMGDVLGDLNSRRAKVEGMEQRGHAEVIRAKVPMAEALRYATDLTSLTSGRGTFDIAFSHYEPVAEALAARVVAEVKARQAGN
jgi:elongation factor G